MRINPDQPWQVSVDQAREMAKARFRDRVQNGEQVGGCSCHDDKVLPAGAGESRQVVGVRFRDSARVYFFTADDSVLDVGSWVACSSQRGVEAARVVIAPKQVLLEQIEGELKPIERVLSDEEMEAIDARRRETGRVVRTAGAISRAHNYGIKAVSAEYTLDGSTIRIAYSAQDHTSVDAWHDALEDAFGAPVELASVGPRDEARLIGGLGKCGRTLCCSSWLPMFPESTMGMAKNQDLSLNPTKVSGLCGRLLCCLSYENEQYRKAKQILPRLGQTIMTDEGEAMVISLQVLKELVTLRYAHSDRVETLPASDVLGGPKPAPRPVESAPIETIERPVAVAPVETDAAMGEEQPRRRRRRRGRRSRSGDGGDSGPEQGA